MEVEGRFIEGGGGSKVGKGNGRKGGICRSKRTEGVDRSEGCRGAGNYVKRDFHQKRGCDQGRAEDF